MRPGDDLAALLAAARGAERLRAGRGARRRAQGGVQGRGPRRRAARRRAVAARAASSPRELGKDDPRHVEVVLRESAEVVRARARRAHLPHAPRLRVRQRRRRRVQRRRRADELILLPADPDASARALRAALPAAGSPAVVIADSFGRAWRHGQCDVAIGIAGLAPLEDWRGRTDAHGRELHATWIAIADQAAAAADLARGGKDARRARGRADRAGAPRDHRRRRPGRGGARPRPRRGPVRLDRLRGGRPRRIAQRLDAQLARAARRRDRDGVARRRADERLGDRRLGRQLAALDVGLGRADDRVAGRAARRDVGRR